MTERNVYRIVCHKYPVFRASTFVCIRKTKQHVISSIQISKYTYYRRYKKDIEYPVMPMTSRSFRN